jgi:hypothetical protein
MMLFVLHISAFLLCRISVVYLFILCQITSSFVGRSILVKFSFKLLCNFTLEFEAVLQIVRVPDIFLSDILRSSRIMEWMAFTFSGIVTWVGLPERSSFSVLKCPFLNLWSTKGAYHLMYPTFFFIHWHYSPSGARPTSMKLRFTSVFFRILDSR